MSGPAEVLEGAPSFELFGALMVKEDRRGKEAEEVAAAAARPCPRCKSRETKFCYFNNYDAKQPRHLCKACRRYWTAGGSAWRRRRPRGGLVATYGVFVWFT